MDPTVIPINGLGGKIVEQSFEISQAVSYEVNVNLQKVTTTLIIPFNATVRTLHQLFCSNYQFLDANAVTFTTADSPETVLAQNTPLMSYPEFYSYYEQANAILKAEGEGRDEES